MHRVHIGVPLPFNVRHADTTLLLARGHKIGFQEQHDALFARGALVDVAELRPQQDLIRLAPPDQMPGLWGQCLYRVADADAHRRTKSAVPQSPIAERPYAGAGRAPEVHAGIGQSDDGGAGAPD